MIRYTAKMEHNSKTIEKLVETQQRVFQFGQRVGYMLISALLIIYGLYADKSMYTSYLALFAGCVMVTGLSFNTKRHAQALVKQMEGNFPKSNYTFTDQGFTDYSEGDIIPYQKLYRLVEDQKYLYLYVNKQSAYMVDKSTVLRGTPSDLKNFLSSKTALNWTRPNSLLNLSFLKLFREKEAERKSSYQGPRLK